MVSILNDVLGPVMRGPSSSHTAGPFFIGRIVRQMLDEELSIVEIIFDSNGSFARVYKEQASDIGFAAGLLGLSIIDTSFDSSLEKAKNKNCEISFNIDSVKTPSHPNAVIIRAVSESGKSLNLTATSIGGGQIQIIEVDDIPIVHDARRPRLLVVSRSRAVIQKITADIISDVDLIKVKVCQNSIDPTGRSVFYEADDSSFEKLAAIIGSTSGTRVYKLPSVGIPVYDCESSVFTSVSEIHKATQSSKQKLSEIGRQAEARLLALPEDKVTELMHQRWNVMEMSVRDGLRSSDSKMRLLPNASPKIFEALNKGRLICDRVLPMACGAALAVMETNSSGGVVCAAPTAGSSGIIPGVLFALKDEKGTTDGKIVDALFAMGVVGALVASRATFAAEICGCAAETGVAAAMAAAGLVESAGGDSEAALDAASLCLMNTLGLVCDPVKGLVEIPCHARNIGGVAQALAAADSVLGGFRTRLPLDEVIDVMFDVGRQLPSSLRCTGNGGLAKIPSAHLL